MDNMTRNNTNSNRMNAVRGITSYAGEKPEDFADWHRKAGFIISMQRPDIFAVMEGQSRPTEEADQAEDTAPLLTPGLLYTAGGTLLQRQAEFDRANQDLYAILYLVTDKAAALLVAIHAYDERGTRGDGQKTMKELEAKYLRVTNETIRALQAALAATTMEPDQDPDHYIMQATRLRSRLAAVKEPVTDRHFTDIIVQGLPESYRDIKLTTYKDPDFDLSKIQTTMRHLYLDGLSRRMTGKIAGRGTIMTAVAASSSDSSSVVICHNCGKDGHYKSGCSVPGKLYGKGKKPAAGPNNKKAGDGAGQKWCSVHKTTTHSDTKCYAQGAARPQTTSSTHTAALVRVDTDERPTVKFDDDFDKGFQF